jgi:predicted nuclease of predicted toxin-antitoxin system
MRFVAEECVSPVVVAWLRGRGHDVLSILEAHRSAKDGFVLALAAREGRILLTEDNDYGEMIFRGGVPNPAGMILLRMLDATAAERVSRLEAGLAEAEERVLGHHIVIGPSRTRIRKLP